MDEGRIIKKIIDATPAGIACFDKNFNIIYWNEELTHILGYKKEESPDMKEEGLELHEKRSKESILDVGKCLKKGKVQNVVYILNRRNEYKPVYVNSKIVNDENIYAIITITDYSVIEACRINDEEPQEEYMFHNIAGKDKAMLDIYRKIELASESLANVLVYGESGTGKELIARAIHDLSDRKDNPFIVVNCSALSESLLESELFGHVKGSFTGAYKDKIGKFETAHSGTIFLDEIGDISPLIQLKLLRVIQEKTIQRVGDNQEIKVDMRIIAATNKNLRELVSQEKFREDLFYRLNVFPINTVPLRNRKNDMPILARHFINKFNHKTGKKILGLTDDSSRLMLDYCWPGNVRELENCIEHAFVVCSTDFIEIFDLPQELRIVGIRQGICKDMPKTAESESVTEDVHQKRLMNPIHSKLTKEELIVILNKNKWNKTQTAEELGITRVALWKKMKKFGI